MTDDSRLLENENQELREQLSVAQELLLKQQRTIETMERQIQKLVLQAPPTSPTSIMENSLCACSKGLLVRSPPIAPCRKTSLSSEEQKLLISILAGSGGNEEVAEDCDLPNLVDMVESDTLSCSDRRLSSITIPDTISSNKGSAKKMPEQSRSSFRNRRPTPLPLTPEKSSFNGEDEDETGSQSSSVNSEVTDDDLEEPLDKEYFATADVPPTPRSINPQTSSTKNHEDDQSDMPELMSMASSLTSRRFSFSGKALSNKYSSSANSASHVPWPLSRRPTPLPSMPLPSTPERKSTSYDGDDDDESWSPSEDTSTATEEKDDELQHQDRDESRANVPEVPEDTASKKSEQSMSDAYLAAAMSKLASSDLPPRPLPRSGACQDRGKRPVNKEESNRKAELHNDPSSSPRTPQAATGGRKLILANAVRGLPRECSIEQHSDDDITIYPSPAGGLGRTVEVSKHQVLDAKNERGLYTGSIDRKSHLPDGYGTMVYRQGQKYTGDWERGQWHGHGVLKTKSGDAYEGFFVNHEKHGRGISRFLDGRVFEGRFQSNEMRDGKLSFTDNSCYEGLMKNGRRHDFGMYTFYDGSYYEGQWENDQIHGRGRIQWVDGSSYNGDWHLGTQHGMGTEIGPDGKVHFQGQFSNGHPVVQVENSTSLDAHSA